MSVLKTSCIVVLWFWLSASPACPGLRHMRAESIMKDCCIVFSPGASDPLLLIGFQWCTIRETLLDLYIVFLNLLFVHI